MGLMPLFVIPAPAGTQSLSGLRIHACAGTANFQTKATRPNGGDYKLSVKGGLPKIASASN